MPHKISITYHNFVQVRHLFMAHVVYISKSINIDKSQFEAIGEADDH